MKNDNPSFGARGLVDCVDCPFDDGTDWNTEFCKLNRCPTRETYADAVALAEDEPHH